MKKIIMVLLICFFIGHIGYAQIPPLKKYVIITFEEDYKITMHNTKTFYWMLPVDSVLAGRFTLGRLYMDGFSQDNLSDCCLGKPIDPYIAFSTKITPLTHEYFNELNELEKIIKKKRIKIQTIVTKWSNKQKKEVRIYATPVSGQFCSSPYHVLGRQRTNYNGMVYLPYSSYSYLRDLWNSAIARDIVTHDFSTVKYGIISN